MAAPQGPQPKVNTRWIDPDGTPSLSFRLYMLAVDQLLTALAGNFLGAPTQLTNAANDGAAAAAGVAIGQLYRNGSVVQIRVT